VKEGVVLDNMIHVKFKSQLLSQCRMAQNIGDCRSVALQARRAPNGLCFSRNLKMDTDCATGRSEGEALKACNIHISASSKL
jgi:hypothetical protein